MSSVDGSAFQAPNGKKNLGSMAGCIHKDIDWHYGCSFQNSLIKNPDQTNTKCPFFLGGIVPFRFKFHIQALLDSSPTITFKLDSVGQH